MGELNLARTWHHRADADDAILLAGRTRLKFDCSHSFTISVPSDAGAALQTVKIVQEQNLDRVRFDPAHSRAFLGDNIARGQSVSLAAIGGELPKNQSIVTFNPPIQPGQTVTVVLDAPANLWYGGVYCYFSSSSDKQHSSSSN